MEEEYSRVILRLETLMKIPFPNSWEEELIRIYQGFIDQYPFS